MDDRRAYDPDQYFGRAVPRDVPDLKADARERLEQARAYARLHAPELLGPTDEHRLAVVRSPAGAAQGPSRLVSLTDEQRVEAVRELVEFEYRTGGSMFEYERQAKARLGR